MPGVSTIMAPFYVGRHPHHALAHIIDLLLGSQVAFAQQDNRLNAAFMDHRQIPLQPAEIQLLI
jgi:hypothetical protein